MSAREKRLPRCPRSATIEAPLNLNDSWIPVEHSARPMANHGTIDGDVEVVFRHLDRRLIALIEEADYVVGCVAWLTHPDILDALAKKQLVCLVVQKEDFLRPDLDTADKWRADLRRRYRALRCCCDRWGFPGLVRELSMCADGSIDAVRCVGNHNADKHPAFPRAHHKFVVFGKLSQSSREDHVDWLPYAVWTGSFNFTKNAAASLENAVVLRQPKIVAAFAAEFEQTVALSEPLDWEWEWMTPEWRIGT